MYVVSVSSTCMVPSSNLKVRQVFGITIFSSERVFRHLVRVSVPSPSEDESIMVKLYGAMAPPFMLEAESLYYIEVLVTVIRDNFFRSTGVLRK